MSAAAWQARYNDRYKREWGVDIAGVRRVSSGYMLRFSYRVVDPAKAAPLLDEKAKPYLYDVASGARFAVPAMENVGELRQTGKPVPDRTYFVIFGNPGKLVRSGSRVRIVIGNFEVDDLVVD
ncbi:MAG: putative transrane protein [Gammaproteobacteria bacterium]|nr:putative transrane protein [Gammaproteobacteria bacterium]